MSDAGFLILRRMTIPLARLRGIKILVNLWRILIAKLYKRTLVIEDFDRDLKFVCVLHEHMSSQVFWYGFYSRAALKILDNYLTKNMFFVDAGANQGEFTLYASKRCAKVVAFEPSHFQERLKRNILLNSLTNIVVENRALGSCTGKVMLYDSNEDFNDGTYNEGLATLYPGGTRSAPKFEVSMITLDDYIEENNIERVDVIKMDVEGSELDILMGAQTTIGRFKPVMLVEINKETCTNAGYSMGKLYDFIVGFGYRAYKIRRSGFKSISRFELGNFQNVLFVPDL